MTLKDMRKQLGLSQAGFAGKYNIPVKTLQNWEMGRTEPPAYVLDLLERAVLEDAEG